MAQISSLAPSRFVACLLAGYFRLGRAWAAGSTRPQGTSTVLNRNFRIWTDRVWRTCLSLRQGCGVGTDSPGGDDLNPLTDYFLASFVQARTFGKELWALALRGDRESVLELDRLGMSRATPQKETRPRGLLTWTGFGFELLREIRPSRGEASQEQLRE